ncbi:hypothetical protein IEQ34_026846 [Dendrobium chrysotoxum]|uniref:Uncharacterized protein n=1 Tax=Dendrobium chrysotoxum TaxID=161865 RepID=A0AAV7FLA5_DENCH|nr:hypothetical protein IEQ34_026846 [Dendrobium chrysotoxum]
MYFGTITMALHYPSFRLVGGVAPLGLRKPRLQLYRPTAVSASNVYSATKARFVARRSESSKVQQLQRPLADYMALPASQYSVLDAQRIERVDENTFRCYVYRIKFFTFEVCPVLVVRVEEEPYGCCIRLLSCKVMLFNTGLSLPVSPFLRCLCEVSFMFFCVSLKGRHLSKRRMINSLVTVEIPFLFRGIPTNAIESTGTQVLEQLLGIMLPRFLNQLVKDYQAWASVFDKII